MSIKINNVTIANSLTPVNLEAGDNITIIDNVISADDQLPSRSGQSGKYLTTDGTSLLWNTVDALPSQTGQSGKFLTTDGSSASWAEVDALPSQTGQSGKYLTTDGSVASWAEIQGGSANPDNITITENEDNEIQAVGLLNANPNSGYVFDWVGTTAEYEAQSIATLHPEYTCFITDDNSQEIAMAECVIDQNPNGTVKYDWIGTTAEYNSQNVKTLHPEWVCYITDDTILTTSGADQDLSNLTDEGKIFASGLGMPNGIYEEIALGSTGFTYTAPANGYFAINKAGSNGQYVFIENLSRGYFVTGEVNCNGYSPPCNIPALKGDELRATFTLSGTTWSCRFYYAQGAISEAD